MVSNYPLIEQKKNSNTVSGDIVGCCGVRRCFLHPFFKAQAFARLNAEKTGIFSASCMNQNLFPT
jgi:hypothetical protein